MQFLPSTWEVYGLGGDIRDEHDAVLGAQLVPGRLLIDRSAQRRQLLAGHAGGEDLPAVEAEGDAAQGAAGGGRRHGRSSRRRHGRELITRSMRP